MPAASDSVTFQNQAVNHEQHEILFADAMTMGSTQVISAGQKEYTEVNLVPGKYFAVCLLRDPKTGKLHADMGILSTFTVE